MFWKIKTKEYLELLKLIRVLQLDVEQLQQRFMKKIKPVVKEDELEHSTINDGFDELRKLNKAN